MKTPRTFKFSVLFVVDAVTKRVWIAGPTRGALAHAHIHAPEEMERSQNRARHKADGLVEHDGHVGQLLKKLDDLGLAENTIVVYTTDNGAEMMS
jgi:arylsulfatase A-like enzyme